MYFVVMGMTGITIHNYFSKTKNYFILKLKILNNFCYCEKGKFKSDFMVLRNLNIQHPLF